MRYKRRFERVTKGVELTRATCDFCGGPDVPEDFWDRTEVEIQGTVGSVYPESDCRQRTWIDCCSACFESKVVPAIETLGVKFRTHPVETSLGDPYPDAAWDPDEGAK